MPGQKSIKQFNFAQAKLNYDLIESESQKEPDVGYSVWDNMKISKVSVKEDQIDLTQLFMDSFEDWLEGELTFKYDEHLQSLALAFFQKARQSPRFNRLGGYEVSDCFQPKGIHRNGYVTLLSFNKMIQGI